MWRRILIPMVQNTASITTKYRRAAEARTYGVTFNAICPVGSVIIKEWNVAGL
jgi:hypothetical protein